MTIQTILLVEDNFVNQMLAVTLLEKLGAKVKKAENGSEALDAVRQDHFDLIFMDIQMPDMDGLAATRLIRKLNNDASTTPIIAMTANSLAEHREDCFAAGMDDYLAKPINLDDLRRAISDWEGRRSGKAISKAVA